MKYLFIVLFFIFITSCEQLFYGSYRIIEFDKKLSSEKNYSYKVKKGDNLYLISKKKLVSINELIKINNLKKPYKIYPNQIITLPSKNYHHVKKNETLYSISRKYNVDRFELSKINNLRSINKIIVGQKLIVPNLPNHKIKKLKTKNQSPEKNILNNKNTFLWPAKGKIVLNFGLIKPGLHNDGINILSRKGENVLASKSGKVIYTGNEIPGYGNLVLIRHTNNWITAYAHMDKIIIKRGKDVKTGEVIGTIGSTGNVNVPQLHFEIRRGKKALNPIKFLS